LESATIKDRQRTEEKKHTGKKNFKIAYTMSRFPKLTETFILYEILALEKMGVHVELYPLIREYQKVVHPEAAKMIPRAHFHPLFSLSMYRAHWYYILHKPKAYFRVLFEMLMGTFGSFNFFMGAMGIYPKTVVMAYKMERAGIDHLHAHFANHPAVAALIINRLTGIPYSFTAHGSDLHVERKMLDKKVENSAFTVTISEFNKNVILDECGRQAHGKIEVVHCGVNPDEFKPDWQAKESRPFQIVCIASFEEVKGHIYLLQACQLLNKKGLDFECHLVGYGPLKKQIIGQVKQMGLDERIIIHPPKARPEIIQIYAQSHVKVLPSVPTKQGKREGIPVVLMEAMAMGLPVVSSQLSGIPELVENGTAGILVGPRDAKAIAAALEQLYHDHELRLKMGKAGRERVIKDFNLPKNAKQLSKLFLSKFEPTNDEPRLEAEMAEI
jgi:glycosyltransferase involved in cell wall biosynthesis